MTRLPENGAAIIALCFTQAVGIATIMHIFPFIAPLMLSRGVDPDKVSTYSGMAESAISLVSLVAMRLHVWMAARYRHRPLQIFSLLACGTVSATIGFCQHAWQMIFLRGQLGLVMVGSVLNVVVVGELVTKETKSQAFSWFAASVYLGSMGGAALGGYLADPGGRVPLFGRWGLFNKYPYVLPGTTVLACSVVACLGVLVFVPETGGAEHRDTVDSYDDDEPAATLISLIKNRSYRNLMLIHFSGRICYFGSLGLMTAAGQLPTDIGGLGLRIPDVARILLVSQLAVSVVLIFFAGPLVERATDRQVALLSSLGWFLLAAFFPVTKILPTSDNPNASASMGFWLLGQSLGMLMEPKRNLVIPSLYPRSADRALALAFSKQSAAAAGAIGAAVYGAIFGWSSRREAGSFGRQVVWVWTGAMAIVALLVAVCARVRSNKDNHQDEEVDEHTRLFRDDAEESRASS